MKYCKKLLISMLALILLVSGTVVAVAAEEVDSQTDVYVVDDEGVVVDLDDDFHVYSDEPSDGDLAFDDEEEVPNEALDEHEELVSVEAFLLTNTQASMATWYGVTTTNTAYLRQGPGASHTLIRTLSRGTQLEVLEASANGNWLQVRIGNQLGFVATNRVVSATRLGETTTATAYFRQGPGASHTLIRTLSRGTELEILGASANGNWQHVRIGNQLGWVATNRVTGATRLGVTTTNTAYFRQGPGTSHASMRTLSQGTALDILGASANGNWLHVRIGNQYGFVATNRVVRVIRFGMTTTNTADFRQGPGTSHTSMRVLSRGAELEIVGASTNGNWLSVRIGNQLGWVATNRVATSARAGVTTTTTAYFRQGPGTSHALMRTLSRGTQLEILGVSVNGNWQHVRIGNQLGWVATNRVTRGIESFTASVTAYLPNCPGCTGITANGTDVRTVRTFNDRTFGNIRIIAADRRFPFGTIIYISSIGPAVVLDRGGVVTGNVLDLLMLQNQNPWQFGRQSLQAHVIRMGW